MNPIDSNSHVGVVVSDIYAMEMFYCQIIGFRRLYRYVSRNTPGLRTVFIERDGLILELMTYGSAGTARLPEVSAVSSISVGNDGFGMSGGNEGHGDFGISGVPNASVISGGNDARGGSGISGDSNVSGVYGIDVRASSMAASETRRTGFHIAIGCADVDGMYARLAALPECAVSQLTSPRLTGDGFSEFSFRDPEGNAVEVCNRVRAFENHTVRAVIFDFDGTLVDSEPNYYESDRAMMLEFGIDLTEELKREFIGVGARQMMQVFKARYGLSQSVEQLLEIKDRFYLKRAVGNTAAYPEMVRLVRALHESGVRLAVASGSTREALEILMTETGLRDYFDVVVSASEVPNSKPAPDIFLEAARRLGVNPDETAVFEDAAFGIEAAVSAGMRCYAIPSFPDDGLAPAYFMADRLVPAGMSAFRAEDALSWLRLIV